jgi:hypothetical protein
MDALTSNADVQQFVTIVHSPACNGMLQQKNLVGKVASFTIIRTFKHFAVCNPVGVIRPLRGFSGELLII